MKNKTSFLTQENKDIEFLIVNCKSTFAGGEVAGIEVELIDETRPINSSPRKLALKEQSLFFGFRKFLARWNKERKE